jgi:hypothetical protein
LPSPSLLRNLQQHPMTREHRSRLLRRRTFVYLRR